MLKIKIMRCEIELEDDHSRKEDDHLEKIYDPQRFQKKTESLRSFGRKDTIVMVFTIVKTFSIRSCGRKL